MQDLSKRNNITRRPILVYRTHAGILGNRDALGERARGLRDMQAHRERHANARHVIIPFSAFRRSRSSEPHDGVPQGSTERSADPRRAAACMALNQRLRRRRAKYR